MFMERLIKQRFFSYLFLWLVSICLSISMFVGPPSVWADSPDTGYVCGAYLTGIGCGNCAVTDPVILTQMPAQNPEVIVLEFEIFHDKMANLNVKKRLFNAYLPKKRSGVPFFILNKTDTYLGRLNVLEVPDAVATMKANACPMPSGQGEVFEKVDLTKIPGRFKVWAKQRVLMSGPQGDNTVLKKVLTEPDLSQALQGIPFVRVDPIPVLLSGAELTFQHAVMLDQWRLQWNGDPIQINYAKGSMEGVLFWLLLTLIFLGGTLSFLRIHKTKKGAMKVEWKGKRADYIIASLSFLFLIVFFVLAKTVSPTALEQSGYDLPLPVFTMLIAFIDGFNPCNMFVLTCLLALLIATSATRFRVFIVAISFIATVYVFYFTFMAAWLNIFNYLHFINPLRIALGLLALVVGLINCKELFFFRKGVSLMIQDKHKGPLMRKIEGMKDVVQTGSLPLLIVSSLALASLASLVELPCTAGFPILYTGILSGRGLEESLTYYLYLLFYNLIYVLPLIIIICIYFYTFKARQITQRHMEIIKFIGGIIMVLLGIILLVNPQLVGLNVH
jgi:cytochrome c biogenesis protein CcdA